MKKFPVLNEYSSDELIIITFDEQDHWQKEAIIYAKSILLERGISEESAKERFNEIQIESEKLWKKELEFRKADGFHPIELVLMTVFWFSYILHDWKLNKYGYKKRRKQRLIAIGIGMIGYFIIISTSIPSKEEYKQTQQAEINRIDSLARIDSLEIAKIDWSGTYVFMDSVEQNGNQQKIEWKIEINKGVENHTGLLTLNNMEIVNCVGLIKENGIEFYPDTTYNLFDKYEISYYDLLFTFASHENEVFTHWGKLKPFYFEHRNGTGLFRKNSL